MICLHVAFCNVTELKNIKGKLKEHNNVGWHTSTHNILDTNHCVLTAGKHTFLFLATVQLDAQIPSNVFIYL